MYLLLLVLLLNLFLLKIFSLAIMYLIFLMQRIQTQTLTNLDFLLDDSLARTPIQYLGLAGKFETLS